jgi:protein-disulfide isomerase
VPFRFFESFRTNSSALSVLSVLSALSVLTACHPRSPSPEELKATLVAHPDILFEVIKAHPAEFFQVVQRAAAEYQKTAGAAAQQDSIRMEQDLADPKRPAIVPGRATRGPATAPIVIVEYSDFQCPFCHRSVGVLRSLFANYDGRIRLVLKEAPLDMHPHAMAAARYFEAVLRQDSTRAWQLHDLLFDNQARLGKEGDSYIEEAVKQVGADLPRARRDAAGPEVQAVIAGDLAEFQAFGFSGTPGFVVNGVRLEGSYPLEAMTAVIERTLKK